MKRCKVALGLSGGVDSAVSAALLKEQEYDVTGVFIICYRGPGCRTDEDRKDALDVALKLGIPFEVLDFREAYQEKVLEYFKTEYLAGRTPNPDIVCNREIKFGLFYQWALDHGFDYVATGHYARIDSGCLLRSKDEHKDQTYFLYQLRKEQLSHILFPIGEMTKPEVRQEAVRRGLPVAKKPDSQGICFIGEVSITGFLKKMGVKENPGKVVNLEGQMVGTHRGTTFYTIGQRGGWTVDSKYQQKFKGEIPSLYVVAKDTVHKVLVVGGWEDCLKNILEVGEIHWIDQVGEGENVNVRIRHGGELIPVKLEQQETKLKVNLTKPAFGVAPGQAAVFYKDEVCLGGGIVS